VSAPLVSLLVVTIGFTLLVAWVYWPSHRTRLEQLGRIPLGDELDRPPTVREDAQT
jgi:cbb3-type cytochrome oxidase subunit 3